MHEHLRRQLEREVRQAEDALATARSSRERLANAVAEIEADLVVLGAQGLDADVAAVNASLQAVLESYRTKLEAFDREILERVSARHSRAAARVQRFHHLRQFMGT